MMEVSNDKTQRVNVTQYDPLYLLSAKKQVDSKRKAMGQSTMFKENLIIQNGKIQFSMNQFWFLFLGGGSTYLSSPVPKPPRPNTNKVPIRSKTKRGLTLKCYRPPPTTNP